MSKEAENLIVVSGLQRTIEYAVRLNGTVPAREFIEEKLNLAEQAQLMPLFQRMADHGSVPNREQFKIVEGEIFEFKKHQMRIFCFRRGRRWLLTNGYKKKKDKLDPNEIQRANRIMLEVDQKEQQAK